MEDVLDPREHRLLGEAVLVLADWTNVAYPCPGFWAFELRKKGLMSMLVSHDGRERLTTFTVTPAGRLAYLSYKSPYVPISPDIRTVFGTEWAKSVREGREP